MKFKVGDKVRVREDLEEGKYYLNEKATEIICLNRGLLFKIAEIDYSRRCYMLEGDFIACDTKTPLTKVRFTDEMLELVEGMNPEQYKKDQAKQIKEENERNCDTCKHDDDYFDCSQCSDFDEWEGKEDLIHNPKHYTYSNHEPIDVIKAWNLDFDLGNVVKYIARCEHKGNKLLDLQKALVYLQHEIKCLEDKPCN